MEFKSLDDVKTELQESYKINGFLNQKDIDDAIEHLDLNDQESEDLLLWFAQNNISITDDEDDSNIPDAEHINADLELFDDDIDVEEETEDSDFNALASDIETLEQSFANAAHTKIWAWSKQLKNSITPKASNFQPTQLGGFVKRSPERLPIRPERYGFLYIWLRPSTN